MGRFLTAIAAISIMLGGCGSSRHRTSEADLAIAVAKQKILVDCLALQRSAAPGKFTDEALADFAP